MDWMFGKRYSCILCWNGEIEYGDVGRHHEREAARDACLTWGHAKAGELWQLEGGPPHWYHIIMRDATEQSESIFIQRPAVVIRAQNDGGR